MHPIHDVDVILLLAMALASKRRPAAIGEIMAAIDMMQGAIPTETKLAEAFSRLTAHGLIGAAAGGFTLTPVAQTLMAGQPRKINAIERILVIKEKLAAHPPVDECAACAPLPLTPEQLGAAIQAHRATTKNPGKNLLMPKPPAARDYQRPRSWRRGPAAGPKTARKAGRKS